MILGCLLPDIKDMNALELAENTVLHNINSFKDLK